MNRRYVRKTDADKVTITIEYDRKQSRIDIEPSEPLDLIEYVGILDLAKKIVIEEAWEEEE